MKEKIKTYLIIAVSLVIGFALVGGAAVLSKKQNSSGANAEGVLTFDQANYNFGNIPINGGTVKHSFTLKNESRQAVTVKGMKTSCMCTTAILKYKGRQSPSFGMHNNPAFYSQKIEPGEQAEIVAIFDPLFHGPSGTGYITRVIDLFTDKENYKLKFSANVTP